MSCLHIIIFKHKEILHYTLGGECFMVVHLPRLRLYTRHSRLYIGQTGAILNWPQMYSMYSITSHRYASHWVLHRQWHCPPVWLQYDHAWVIMMLFIIWLLLKLVWQTCNLKYPPICHVFVHVYITYSGYLQTYYLVNFGSCILHKHTRILQSTVSRTSST